MARLLTQTTHLCWVSNHSGQSSSHASTSNRLGRREFSTCSILHLSGKDVVQSKPCCGVCCLTENRSGEARPERGDAFKILVVVFQHQLLNIPSRTANVCIAFSIGCFEARTCMQLSIVSDGLSSSSVRNLLFCAIQRMCCSQVSKTHCQHNEDLLKQAAIEADAPLPRI